MKRIILIIILLLIAIAPAMADSEGGWFGFRTSIKGGGLFWNPTLVSITIEDVAPSSPAAAQGLTKGDQILDVEGQPIAGQKGKDVQALVQSKKPGEKLAVRLRRTSGEIYDATLVAATKPVK